VTQIEKESTLKHNKGFNLKGKNEWSTKDDHHPEVSVSALTTLRKRRWLHFPDSRCFPFISSNIPAASAYAFHNFDFILALAFSTVIFSNKVTFLLCWSHRYNNYAVAIKKWLIAN